MVSRDASSQEIDLRALCRSVIGFEKGRPSATLPRQRLTLDFARQP
jgi:hypothetical protein